MEIESEGENTDSKDVNVDSAQVKVTLNFMTPQIVFGCLTNTKKAADVASLPRPFLRYVNEDKDIWEVGRFITAQ